MAEQRPRVERAALERAVEAYRKDHRSREVFAGLTAPDGFLAVRIDGRAFHTLTQDMDKPFDSRFEAAMEKAAEAVMAACVDPACCYVQSDEITVVLPPACRPYDRRIEKLTSVLAGVATGAFVHEMGVPAAMDARILACDDETGALAVLVERQDDAARNAVTALAYWTLRAGGIGPKAADTKLRPLGLRDRLDLLEQLGVPAETLSRGRRYGRLLVKELVRHVGTDPRSGASVPVVRRRLVWSDAPDLRRLEALPGYPVPRRALADALMGRKRRRQRTPAAEHP